MLKKLDRRQRKKARGFTLVELLVVISIISLLSTVVYAVFSTSRVQAQDAQKKETVHSVQNALELYHSTYGAYPPNYSDDLSSNTRTTPAIQGDPVSGAAYNESMQDMVDAGVLPSIPTTSSGASYGYYNTGSSAVFFTELTGGYSGVSANQIYPAMIERYQNYNGSYGLCFDPSRLSTGYQTCQSQGAEVYIKAQTGVTNAAYNQCAAQQTITCDSYLIPPPANSLYRPPGTVCGFLHPSNPPSKYVIVTTPSSSPTFCIPVISSFGGMECYWSN